MIVGIGVDLVDIPRFERSLARTPRLLQRLFSPAERVLAPHSLAARFAAKEALIKAFGDSHDIGWHDMPVVSDVHGNPSFALRGRAVEAAAALGVTSLHLSMSHDAGMAVAMVLAEGA